MPHLLESLVKSINLVAVVLLLPERSSCSCRYIFIFVAILDQPLTLARNWLIYSRRAILSILSIFNTSAFRLYSNIDIVTETYFDQTYLSWTKIVILAYDSRHWLPYLRMQKVLSRFTAADTHKNRIRCNWADLSRHSRAFASFFIFWRSLGNEILIHQIWHAVWIVKRLWKGLTEFKPIFLTLTFPNALGFSVATIMAVIYRYFYLFDQTKPVFFKDFA